MQSPPVAELRLQATRQHLTRPSVASNPHESWIHPHLRHTIDPVKGRQLQVTQVLKKGELLLVDPPYATIPVVDEPLRNDRLLCSHFRCNRQVPCDADRISCPNRCIDDVVWCSSACHEADRERHVFECTWLQRFAPSIRSKWGEYDFGMLWLIVRMLATRAVDRNDAQAGLEQANADSRTFTTGWPAIQSFCGSSESWSHSQVRHWETLVKKYLRDGPVLPHGMPAEGVLSLICKEEANSFGLYPRATGVPLVGGPQVDRGEQFGAAVYPRAAIANHSCEPNVSLRITIRLV